MSSQIRVRLLPNARCLYDEPVQVKVAGLRPRQVVTMRARSTDEKGVVFSSSATYRADESGEIDLDRDPSLGGSYVGVEPMGLLWWMRPETPHRYFIKDKALQPLKVKFSVHKEEGATIIKYAVNNPLAEENKGSLIPIEQAEGRLLFVASEDDLNWDSKGYVDEMVERLKRHGKENFESVCYPTCVQKSVKFEEEVSW
ncbi:acyl-coenzyme A thioesterase 1-like [Chaetodon auriga]|uniref:acyl-coenzyme A thioesterase 1-like n=1 Tax=Chaetodon auriga TaxID=39042 RepID=UPI0040329433